MEVRRYGDESGAPVVVLHGGPGAPGYMAPVARELADQWHVLEPLQRRSGDGPLGVRVHVEDLHAILPDKPVPLVGSSWGAMLALAYAAEHPERVSKLILIGCGTFDREARARLVEIRDGRMDDATRETMMRIDAQLGAAASPDQKNRLLDELADLIHPLYNYDPMTTDLEVTGIDAAGNSETWNDMVRLQDEGVYPAAFGAIEAPAIMLHGDHDPHPGRLIYQGLRPHVADLIYVELEHCGHYPWIERQARATFFQLLRQALREE
jgi:pimeloyl-ACP methyl ester carboxylesterase